MLIELTTLKRFPTDIALDRNFRTVPLYMVSQLRPRQMLEFLQVTNVTPVLRTLIILRMLLQLSNCFPENLTVRSFVTFMGEFAEIHQISDDRIDLLENVTFGLAMWALNTIKLIRIALSDVIEFVLIGLPCG